jgi:DUF4097 and DUF4098 domain-containing protein YvlB
MALAVAIQQSDTTFTVDPTMRLEVTNREGYIDVRTWSRNEVRVRVGVYDARIEVDRTSNALRIGGVARRGYDDDEADYHVTVPETMALDLRTSDGNVSVDGTTGEVMVRVGDGDISVRGGSERVSLRTDDGEIRLENASGRIRLFTMDGDITVDQVAGDVEAETTDGNITLLDVRAVAVQATTVDGDVWFDGTLSPRGSYALSTHDGDVTAIIPETADARVRVARYEGDFTSDFPVTVTDWRRGRRVDFTLGGGSAELQLETFDGDITIRSRGR